jgi:hypothetical protein
MRHWLEVIREASSCSFHNVCGTKPFGDRVKRYGWINRAIPEAELDDFVGNYVRRILSFDKQALGTAKTTINQFGLPDAARLQATQDTFFKTFGWPGALERFPKLRARGIGTAGEFELNLGRHIGDL